MDIYRSSKNNTVYVYDGKKWEYLLKDGEQYWQVSGGGLGKRDVEKTIEEWILNNPITVITSISAVDDKVFNLDCTAAETVGNPVYISSPGSVRNADASSLSTARVFGFICSKDSDTKCNVLKSGLLNDGLSGMSAGTEYFLGTTPGTISTVVPSGPGQIVLPIGTPIQSTILNVEISQTPLIRAL